jgi:hypothetical protein
MERASTGEETGRPLTRNGNGASIQIVGQVSQTSQRDYRFSWSRFPGSEIETNRSHTKFQPSLEKPPVRCWLSTNQRQTICGLRCTLRPVTLALRKQVGARAQSRIDSGAGREGLNAPSGTAYPARKGFA